MDANKESINKNSEIREKKLPKKKSFHPFSMERIELNID